MPLIKTKIDRQSAQFTANTAAMGGLLEDLRQCVETVSTGGGASARDNTSNAASYCHGNASTACSIPAARFWSARSSRPGACTRAKCPRLA